MNSAADNVKTMKQILLLAGLWLLAALDGLAQAPTFNPANLGPGSVVRIAARRPPINLARAEVVQCATNQITVRQIGVVNGGVFTVNAGNVLDLAILESVPAPVSPEARAAATNSSATLPGQLGAVKAAGPKQPPKSGLWERIKRLWSK